MVPAPHPPSRTARPAAGQVYRVPERFHLGAALALITAFALLFGVLRYYEAHPVLYAYLSCQAVLTCVLQMRFGHTPRLASALGGAVLLPLCSLLLMLAETPPLWARARRADVFFMLLTSGLCSAPLGAFLGYCTGVLTAGVFLLLDKLDQRWGTPRTSDAQVAAPESAPSSPQGAFRDEADPDARR